MTDIEELITQAVEAAQQATCFDAQGKNDAAIYLYRLAAFYLHQAQQLGGHPDIASYSQKAIEYSQRAESLEKKGR